MFRLACVLSIISLATCQVTAPRTPVNVYVAVNFNTLDKIDGVEQAFNTDFWLSYYWYDPRVDLNMTAFDRETMWDPAADFVNSRGAIDSFVPSKYEYTLLNDPSTLISNALPEDLALFRHNWVQFNQRYIGSFTAHLDLKQFPFDSQIAQILIESSIYGVSEVVFVPARPKAVFEEELLPDDFVITEWDVTGEKVNVVSKYYPTYGDTYSSFRVEVYVARKPEYYLQKIVAGCVLLVLMCITIFVLDVEEPDRMMGTLTVFLALISFVFVAAADLPKVAYLTKMDSFIFVSFLLVALMAFAHMVAYAIMLHTKEDDDAKDKKNDKKDRKDDKGAPKAKEKEVSIIASSSESVGNVVRLRSSKSGSSRSGAIVSSVTSPPKRKLSPRMGETMGVNTFLETPSRTATTAKCPSLSHSDGSSGGPRKRKPSKEASLRSTAELGSVDEQQEETSSATACERPKSKTKRERSSDGNKNQRRKRRRSCCCRLAVACRGMGPVRKLDVTLMVLFLVTYVIAIAVILRRT